MCFTFPPCLFFCSRGVSDPSERWPLPVSFGLRVHVAARSLWRRGDVGHHCAVILIKAASDWPCWATADLRPCEKVYVQNRTASVSRRIPVYSHSANREIPQKHKPTQQRRRLCWQPFLSSRTPDCCPDQLSAAVVIITDGEIFIEWDCFFRRSDLTHNFYPIKIRFVFRVFSL